MQYATRRLYGDCLSLDLLQFIITTTRLHYTDGDITDGWIDLRLGTSLSNRSSRDHVQGRQTGMADSPRAAQGVGWGTGQ